MAVSKYRDPLTGKFIPIMGAKGNDGKSAYLSAKDGGYVGTEADFNASIGLIPNHIADAEQHITAAERQAWNGKAAPSRGVAAALTAAGWVGSAAPFTQAITVSGVTAACSGSFRLGATTNAEQYKAAATAMLLLTGQAADQITVTAFGEKPTVDLPILITIVG